MVVAVVLPLIAVLLLLVVVPLLMVLFLVLRLFWGVWMQILGLARVRSERRDRGQRGQEPGAGGRGHLPGQPGRGWQVHDAGGGRVTPLQHRGGQGCHSELCRVPDRGQGGVRHCVQGEEGREALAPRVIQGVMPCRPPTLMHDCSREMASALNTVLQEPEPPTSRHMMLLSPHTVPLPCKLLSSFLEGLSLSCGSPVLRCAGHVPRRGRGGGEAHGGGADEWQGAAGVPGQSHHRTLPLLCALSCTGMLNCTAQHSPLQGGSRFWD